jgi:2-methylcitrate dehydratase PrpD
MCWAFGLAATQPVGLREMFGTMTKSFHPGRAAQNGMTAALLAQQGYTSSEQAIEAKRGWANVLSTAHNYAEITENLGQSYEILANTYKPFACGIVIHPAIDGCIQIRAAENLDPAAIERVDLKVHHLVLELTGKTAPKTGLEGKFSVYHAAAMAFIDGDGGEVQFSDQAVMDAKVIALRDRIKAEVDTAIAPDEVRMVVTMKDGRVIEHHVPHAIGSVARPMTDADLAKKFHGLADPILGKEAAGTLLAMGWRVGGMDRVAAIAEAARLQT